MTSNLFFVIGPLRTGSSLMSRCLDDHPQAICLCESEINRALVHDYFVMLHFNRMRQHGLVPRDVIRLLDHRKQDDIHAVMSWYDDSQERFAELYQKPRIQAFGDKSPDFFRSPQLVNHLAERYRLIYTVRDPRAIFWSIAAQTEPTDEEKRQRWKNLTRNFLAWEPWLDRENILPVRYEDLIRSPETTMESVYTHVGLPASQRFREPFERLFPKRFLWQTTIDWESGIRREFDAARIDHWKGHLSADDLSRIQSNEHVARFMQRFDYS